MDLNSKIAIFWAGPLFYTIFILSCFPIYSYRWLDVS